MNSEGDSPGIMSGLAPRIPHLFPSIGSASHADQTLNWSEPMKNRKYANVRAINRLRARMVADLERCIEAGLNHEITRVFWPQVPVPARIRSGSAAARFGEP
jgi:hypothetical protein